MKWNCALLIGPTSTSTGFAINAYLVPHKKMKRKKRKRDAFKELLYRKKEEDTASGEFRRYFIAGSAIPATKSFDRICWSQQDVEEAFLSDFAKKRRPE